MPAYIPTYVKGLDDLLGGGIPQGNVVLVAGTPGARKTSLVFSILHNNAHEGRKGIFISLEQRERELKSAMANLGMEGLDDGLLYVMDAAMIRAALENLEVEKDWIEILRRVIKEAVDVNQRELLAIDSLDVLYALNSLHNPRRELFHFFDFLRELDLTTFIVSELSVGSQALSKFGEDFLTDGMLLLKHYEIGETEVQLRLRCVKMRQTPNEEGYYALGFADGGFYVTRIISRKERPGVPADMPQVGP